MEFAESTLDARGRPLQEGDEVLVTIKGPLTFRVTRIAPPNVTVVGAPANMLHIQMEAVLLFLAPRGQPNAEFLRIASVDEIKAAQEAAALAEARKTLVQP